ncbi:MAG: c-type cytochrome [Acidobacteria bacterium]|nr:c-type cytochrome [Acidobacteriota bacterium]
MIESPIIIDFDADGRLWAIEMPAFLPDLSGRDSREPINRVVVLEDTDDDGRMDKRTVFADELVMPRALKVLERGVLVGEPPNLWLFTDVDGDLKADAKTLVTSTYGNASGNIEHNANSVLWAMDNVLYSSEHTFDLRYAGGKFEPVPALSRGQWLISQDDAGRVYRNVNDSPLYVDYTPSRYFLRNPNLVRTRGLFELLIEQSAAIVYPVRPTVGVNRGYRHPGPFFRADGSSIVIQGAGTPTIYRGDRYPKDLWGNAFITDSPTNLVHRLRIVDDGSGRLTAVNGYARGEFLASSDERFRPVSLASAPDGTMYVVDMYRGVVQAGGLWSEYLTDYIKAHDLLMPVAKGRIWRVVHGNDAGRRGPAPKLSRFTAGQLVQTLAHPNGWWRDTAQQLLVQRGDRSIALALERLVTTAPDWRTRLHALWTLAGLEAIRPELVGQALEDNSADVRAGAVKIAERWLRVPGHALSTAVLSRLDDRSWSVRRQLAASMGELPEEARIDPARLLLLRLGDDPVVVDAVLSGLHGLESRVLDQLTTDRARPVSSDAVAMLAAAITKSGVAADVQRLVAAVADEHQPLWRRRALLQGLDAALPAAGGGRGRSGSGLPGISAPGGRVTLAPGRGVSLPAEPASLTVLARGNGPLAGAAAAVVARLDWPGRPAPVVPATPLTVEQQKRYAAGAEIYRNVCAGCHNDDGRGRDRLGANLVGSPFVTAPDGTALSRIMLSGKEGSLGLMPPAGATMRDEDVAAVLTYVRRAWGHAASPINPLDVAEVRGLTRGRTKPWTDVELQPPAGRGGRGGAGRGAQQ